MRDIIFRGKRVDNGEWEYGSLIDMDGQTDQVYVSERFPYASSFTNQQLTAMNMRKVDRETVGQYTGIKDRNGKMIFEGDIVLCTYSWEEHKRVVEYDDYGWLPFTDQTGRLPDSYSEFNYDSFEIIGNIHELKEDV